MTERSSGSLISGVSVGTFIVNSFLCVLFCFPVALPVMVFHQADLLSYFQLWLGVSIGMHAFPSTQDASILWTEAAKAAHRLNPLAILSFPLG